MVELYSPFEQDSKEQDRTGFCDILSARRSIFDCFDQGQGSTMTPPARDAGERASEKAKQSRSKTTDTTKEGTEKRKNKQDKEKDLPVASTSKDSTKTRSSERNRAEIRATGSTNCPARAPEIQDGAVQNNNNGDVSALSARVEQLFTLMGGLAQSVHTLQSAQKEVPQEAQKEARNESNSGKTQAVKRKITHDLSEGETTTEGYSDHDSDDDGSDGYTTEDDVENQPPPDEHYDPLAQFANEPQRDSGNDFDAAVAGLSSFFQGNKEVAGKEINDKLADALNATLRLRPMEASVTELTDKYLYPANIPNLKVPKTNTDIYTDMWKSAQYLDLLLQKCQLMTSKALVPILRLLDDMNTKPKRKIESYHNTLHDSLRLFAATFNSLSQARKDVIRTTFHDSHVSKLCTWDTPVGSDFLFDFDVVAKVDTMTKTKGLRATLKKKRKVSSSGHGSSKRPHSAGYRRPFYPQPQPAYYRSYRPNSYQANSYQPKKPFLGRPHVKTNKKGKSKDRQ